MKWYPRRERYEQWHKFFAIKPRRVGVNDYRWLEVIERKGEWDCEYGWFWQYRSPHRR